MTSKLLLFAAFVCLISIQLGLIEAKICYQCDDKNPSKWWKFWGEKITKCNGVPFQKYASKTSKAFGADVLTCYTKFDEAGNVIKRGAYGFGETFDKNFKCQDRFHICCKGPFCNKHVKAPCPPLPNATQKKEVKACYECNGAEACRPQRLGSAEVRTSSIFGASNLYCYTKFDPKTGVAIARGGFGFGEAIDKNLKCDSKHYLCCYENMCNTHTTGLCDKHHYED
ncbi:unnamed protein product [Adineta ricciae]|uniref:Uncharacterized protein n=1 Tax=Adineta ricciae TaxID=249248 RepID=A0A813YTE0_ADIRI|nr:unnamed protein product [Adineta ricciae]CAF0888872.1 unnamed protein product [Adineta ricciae]